ncbi:MAG: DUF1326 domain-containing protein [Bryobacterales bacterium]
MEACNCKAACPCIFLSEPTEGDCTAVVGWHIEKGNFGTVDLADLNVAMAVYSPGRMHETQWKAALYLDARADEAQKNSLIQIFSGQAGGHPARLGSHVGEVLGVVSAPIHYEQNGKRRSLKIGDVAAADIEGGQWRGRRRGHGDQPPSLHCTRIPRRGGEIDFDAVQGQRL